MLTLLSRWTIVVAGAVGLAGLVCCLEVGAQGDSKTPTAQEEKGKAKDADGEHRKLSRTFLPAKRFCGGEDGCHGKKEPSKDPDIVCDLTEYTKYNKDDKHGIAVKVLKGKRGQDMGARLDLKDVTKSEACLSCHSGVLDPGTGVLNPKVLEPRFNIEEEGVSCSVCHGPHEEWYDRHSTRLKQERWRAFDRKKKEQEFGMTDLWNPLSRAELCASCHIGGRGKKFVTHAMYAAGHPPLPSFEVAAFCDMLPHHWQYLRNKTMEARKLLRYDGVDREQTKLVLVGAAVTLRDSMRLLEHQAREALEADPDRPVLDLANFDCYSCHHDLVADSWRQKRPTSGKPGRVPMPSWPTALVPLAIAHAEHDEMKAKALSAEYEKLVKEVQAAFTVRPYGDTKKIATAAAALARWANDLAVALNDKKCTKDDAKRLLLLLPRLYEKAATDYDSARQIAWAYRSIYKECEVEKIVPEDDATNTAIKDLEEKQLWLRFPREKESIEKWLPEGYKRRAAYEPGPFLEALGRLLRKAP